MTNGDSVRQLDDRALAKALTGSYVNEYCIDPLAERCNDSWDAELDCSPCEACVFRWLKEERHDEH